MGGSPWGCNELDTTEATEHMYTHPVHHTLTATSPETAFHEEITQILLLREVADSWSLLFFLGHFAKN